jgi:hypothetical protein
MIADDSIKEMTMRIVKDLNTLYQLGAYIGNVTSNGNMIIRFNNPKIPSILVAEHYLNELYMYKFNLCLRQKIFTKELHGNQWVYYYPFHEYPRLINEMTIYKSIAKLK